MTDRVVLRDEAGDLGTRHLAARLTDDGDVVIEGQDLGPGVEQAFGEGHTEYEWAWTIRAEHVPGLRAALGADVLPGLAERFSGPDAARLGDFLQDVGITTESWSRVGS